MENRIEVPQNTKNKTTAWFSNSTAGYKSEEIKKKKKRKHTCTPVSIAGLYTIAKIWKQPKCPPTDE